jgi:hypothetical protein
VFVGDADHHGRHRIVRHPRCPRFHERHRGGFGRCHAIEFGEAR